MAGMRNALGSAYTLFASLGGIEVVRDQTLSPQPACRLLEGSPMSQLCSSVCPTPPPHCPATSYLRGADGLQDGGRGCILGVGRLVAAAPIGDDGVLSSAGVLLSVELSGVSLHCFLWEGQNG